MPPFQSEVKCGTILISENDFDLHENESACRTYFHMKGFALRLVLKQRHKRTRKWPIMSLESAKESGISSDDLFIAFYCSVIRSVLKSSCQLFQRGLPKYLSDDIERIQRPGRRAMRIIFPSLLYARQ